MGLTVAEDRMNAFFEAFKTLADEKKRIEDEDIRSLYSAVLEKV